MQILAPRFGTALFYNIFLIQSRNPSFSSSFVAYFRSTPTSFEKWRNKWNNSSVFKVAKPSKDIHGGETLICRPPFKTYIKYKSRQKRANAKKALNDLLFRSGSSKFTLEGEFLKKRETISWDGNPNDPINNKNQRDPLKSSARRASKVHQKRTKSKLKKGNFFEDFEDDPWTHFEATFGSRFYSWSFKSWEDSYSQSRTNGFEWREDSNSRNKWRTASDGDDNDDDDVGSHSDRTTLGLPMTGPIKIEEVKNAFRLSALKWHPDKHQGPSQALAEEKFKLCLSAYKSLCNALSRV